jgi:hypothetical protein
LARRLVAAGLLAAAAISAPARAGVAPADQPRRFASPAEAIRALEAAVKAGDQAALHEIFGPQVQELLSSDPVQNAAESARFAKALAQLCVPAPKGDERVVLDIGAQNWPFPIPLVKKDGKWFFDTEAGKDEIINRRIGGDELTAIGVCRAYVAAQREYASRDRDGSGVLKYAQKLVSTPAKRDGLYWEAADDQELSPFGPLVAKARAEGYAGGKRDGQPRPFHGYLFRILTAQGPAAPGGAYGYIINGNMIAGFALVAHPAHWGQSGIMTFIVNQQGRVYQCNLGQDTEAIVARMTEFNPDANWTVVP